MKSLTLVISLLFVVLLSGSSDALKGKSYDPSEKVIVLVNTVGPFNNPSLTFEYYSLPFCTPPSVRAIRVKQSIGMDIQGDSLFTSLYDQMFKVPQKTTHVCSKTFNMEEVSQFRKAVHNKFFFEFWVDALPVRDFIGTVSDVGPDPTNYYLFTEHHFKIYFNDRRIIHVEIVSDPETAVLLQDGKITTADFKYTSEWIETTQTKRGPIMEEGGNQMEVHWLNIMNSSGLVLLLIGFIIIVVNRIVKKDITRYSTSLEDGNIDEFEYGWKLIHGDVFRYPNNSNLLCAFLGAGAQLLTVCFSLLIFSTVGLLYPEQVGSLYSAAIFIFAFASAVSGAVSASMYKKMEGKKWAFNLILAATIYAVPTGLVSLIADVVARYYHSTSALRITTAIEILAIWGFLGVPLTIIGGIAGRRLTGEFVTPVRTKNAVREIPVSPIYRSSFVQFLVGGFLPFSAIYIELHYIYETIWGRTFYGLYGVLLIVFVLLLLVNACVTITLTYFQLSTEDHRWWWRSFISGGSASFFVLLYSTYYFFVVSQMDGFLQMIKYFSFNFIMCYFFFVTLGAVGFYSSLIFVRYIYGSLKFD